MSHNITTEETAAFIKYNCMTFLSFQGCGNCFVDAIAAVQRIYRMSLDFFACDG